MLATVAPAQQTPTIIVVKENPAISTTSPRSVPPPPTAENPAFQARSINISTRGEAGPYQQVGTLFDAESKRILPLFGRPLYQGSDKWNYYTTTDGYHTVQLAFNYKNKDCMNDQTGCEELYDGDSIVIPEYNATFQVKRYSYATIPRRL